ncbi:MAG TPA: histidinol dehydrogenase [Clostridiaceae bacterium]|nr:histidinol dehydrogenase [Clostridiaceae bacterium]
MFKIIKSGTDEEKEFFKKLSRRNAMDNGEIEGTVKEIIDNVRKNGDKALYEYTNKYDRVDTTKYKLKVEDREIQEAYKNIDSVLLDSIRRAKKNIEKYHQKQIEKSWISTEDNGVLLGQLYRPLEIVGVYVPGGTAPLISSVLMNIIPAKIAGVEKIIMVTPPQKDGKINPAILATANEAGADEIYAVGGAQAIAALAFGTQTIPKVDKIVGPGNIYVATAKKMVYGICDIDMFAGPSEITIIADDTANPVYVAADLLSQAEHDPLAASILLTPSEELTLQVRAEIESQSQYLERKEVISKSIAEYGRAIIVDSVDEAVNIVNKIATEHLELMVKEPFAILGSIKNAGAIFIGSYSSEPVGDYYAGPNHVLPTGGTARFFSPLSVSDFVKKTSVISYTQKALHKAKDDIIRFAEAEGLTAHANAIKVRFE